MDHQHRAANAGVQLFAFAGRRKAGKDGIGQCCRVGFHRPANRILDLLGRVRFAEHALEKELREILIMLAPVMLVVLCPSLGVRQRLREQCSHAVRVAFPERCGRRDQHGAVDALGIERRKHRAEMAAERHADNDGRTRVGGIKHRNGVLDIFSRQMRVDATRAVRLAVATPVQGDDAIVAGEIGDLCLPASRMDDRPGRQEQERRLALSIDVVVDAHAVALDVPGGVRCDAVKADLPMRVLPSAGSIRRSGAGPA